MPILWEARLEVPSGGQSGLAFLPKLSNACWLLQLQADCWNCFSEGSLSDWMHLWKKVRNLPQNAVSFADHMQDHRSIWSTSFRALGSLCLCVTPLFLLWEFIIYLPGFFGPRYVAIIYSLGQQANLSIHWSDFVWGLESKVAEISLSTNWLPFCFLNFLACRYVECSKCSQAIPAVRMTVHVKSKECRRGKHHKAFRCPLCHHAVLPGDAGWREHLLKPPGCPKNPRTVSQW